LPYINQVSRKQIDGHIDVLVDSIRGSDKLEGVINYAVTRLVLGTLKPSLGWSYASLMKVVSTLECVKQEVVRRLISPYENLASHKNGDLLEFDDGEKWSIELDEIIYREVLEETNG